MKFEYWKSKCRWYWHLKAANGEIIAHGEGYRRKIDMLKTITLMRRTALAELEQTEIKRGSE